MTMELQFTLQYGLRRMLPWEPRSRAQEDRMGGKGGRERHRRKKWKGYRRDQNTIKACIMTCTLRGLKKSLHTCVIMSHTAHTGDTMQHLMSHNWLSTLTLFSMFVCVWACI